MPLVCTLYENILIYKKFKLKVSDQQYKIIGQNKALKTKIGYSMCPLFFDSPNFKTSHRNLFYRGRIEEYSPLNKSINNIESKR